MEFVFILIVAFVIFAIMFQNNRSADRAWREVGQSHRLTFDDLGFNSRKLSADRELTSLRIETEQHGKATYTSYRAEFEETLPFEIELKPQKFLSSFTNRIDLEVGDSEIDRKLVISGDSDRVRAWLDSDNRTRLVKLLRRFDSVEMNENTLQAKRHKSVSDKSQLFEDIQILEASANAFIRSANAMMNPEPKPVPPPLPSRRSDKAIEPDPEPVIVEEEDIVETPEPPVIIREPEPDLEVLAPEAIEEPSETPTEDALFALHCRELLNGTTSRYEATRIVEDQLKGSVVSETLVLERAEPFSFDRHLGRGPGVRRTFSLGQLESGTELRITADSPDGLTLTEARNREGQPDEIEGIVVGFDPFSHTIFLRSTQPENSELVQTNESKLSERL